MRDIIRTGRLVLGGYHQSITKISRPEHKVLPPLLVDSLGSLTSTVDLRIGIRSRSF